MGFATRSAAREAVTCPESSSPSRTSPASPLLDPPLSPSRHARDTSHAFDGFAAQLRRELNPSTDLETVLVDRLILAAWRLRLRTDEETALARVGGSLDPLSRDHLRAERSLETTLELLATVRSSAVGHWRRPAPTASRVELPAVDEDAADFEDGPWSNEWPALPCDATAAPAPHEAPEADDDLPIRWQDRLVFDEGVSDTSPVVKGTWVTVSHVVSLIVDGWTWSDVLRSHPELTEDDIRTCLAYTVDQDNRGEY